jgi:hypothetical protein
MMALTPKEYKRTIHELWKERDALRAEVERLKQENADLTEHFEAVIRHYVRVDEERSDTRDADIAAAVEAAKADEREQVMRELWRRSGHAMFDKRLPSDYRLALQNTFGAWRPTPEQSSAHDPSTNNLTGDGGK